MNRYFCRECHQTVAAINLELETCMDCGSSLDSVHNQEEGGKEYLAIGYCGTCKQNYALKFLANDDEQAIEQFDNLKCDCCNGYVSVNHFSKIDIWGVF